MQSQQRSYVLAALVLTVSMATALASIAQQQPLRVTTNDGVSIAFESYGKGRTAIVLIHGWSCDRSYWKGQIEYFAKDYKVVPIDLGGHGESGLGRTDWTIYSFGNDVADVIKELKLERVVLVGHSMGGDVIADAALMMQGRVAGLVLVDVYKKLGEGRPTEQIEAFIKELSTDFPTKVQSLVRTMFRPDADPTLVDFVAKDMSSAPPAVALSAAKSSFTHSRQITHDFEHLKLPVIAINPDNEPTDTESMRKHGVDVMIMPKSGHFLMIEDPKRFNEILNTAIKKIVK
jgi:pimeloyl-ACP methyl ester carboxylesterase